MKIALSLVLLLFIFSEGTAQSKQKSIDSLHQVLEGAPGNTRTELLLLLGKNYLSVNLDSAVVMYRAAYRQSMTDNNNKLEAKALIGLGSVYTNQSQHDSAQVYFKSAERVLEKVKDYELQTALWMNRGILYFHLSNYNEASVEFEKVLELAMVEDNKEDISRCYNNIALCQSYLGNYEGALEMHIQSANLAEEIQDPLGLAKSYNNMGLIYFDLENYDKAEEYLLRSLKIKKDQGADVGVVGSYLNLGNNARKLGAELKDTAQLEKAKQYYLSALELGEKTNYQKGVNISYVNLALVETTLGNYDKGVEYGKLAVRLNKELNDVSSLMTATINLADAYRLKKQFQLAEKEIEKGMALAVQARNKYNEKEALLILSKIKSDNGDFKNGLEYYEKYVALEDSISSTEIKNRVNELETKYKVVENERYLAETRANLAESELKVKQRNNLIYGSLGLALLLGLLGYLVYNQQKLKNRQLKKEGELRAALAQIETQNKLQEQRLRISRDLHDNIGSQLTFVTSSVDNLKFGLKEENAGITRKLTRISEFTTQTIYELRDTIWAMNKSEITNEDLQTRIANFIEKAGVARDEIDFSFTVSEEISPNHTFTSVQGMNVYRIIQEAVNNALKYARASRIEVKFGAEDSGYIIQIIDDGMGFNPDEIEPGSGLHNIKKRAKDLGGRAEITSEKEKGTHIAIHF